MVAQREHPDREGAAADLNNPARAADAAFEPVADHAGAGPDAALGKIGAGRSEGALDLPPTDNPVGDLVEFAVVALAHNRVDAAQPLAVFFTDLGRMLDERVGYQPDAEGVGQCDRGFELAELLNLDKAGRFAVAVDDGGRGRAFVEIDILPREDDGDAGVVTGVVHRAVADAHAGHIGQRVARPRLQPARCKPQFTNGGHGRLPFFGWAWYNGEKAVGNKE